LLPLFAFLLLLPKPPVVKTLSHFPNKIHAVQGKVCWDSWTLCSCARESSRWNSLFHQAGIAYMKLSKSHVIHRWDP
jgi:hypothetical protein